MTSAKVIKRHMGNPREGEGSMGNLVSITILNKNARDGKSGMKAQVSGMTKSSQQLRRNHLTNKNKDKFSHRIFFGIFWCISYVKPIAPLM